MKSKLVSYETTHLSSIKERRQQLKAWMEVCRVGTLALFEDMDEKTFRYQPHPDFSPVGWHLGHIGYTESLWLLERCANSILTPLNKGGKEIDIRRLFAADGLPKEERVNLPKIPETYDYLDRVRKQVFDYLEIAPLDEQERLWRFIIQHESQHCETISLLLQLQGYSSVISSAKFGNDQEQITQEMIQIPAGEFEMGNDGIDALDNERPRHRIYVDSYWIDRYPVTCQDYRQFITDGGYQNRELWLAEGWEWVQANGITQPLYWLENADGDDYPVCGVSWYEADAYARFVGKRLPTEAEWEKAACWDVKTGRSNPYPWGEMFPDDERCNHNNIHRGTTPINVFSAGKSASGVQDMLGNVWEWTASWFDGYQGFEYYPYRGYSQAYFDGKHRVLKGGSWATRPWALRCSFRNWYYPEVRQILAGFRCAKSSF